MDKTLQEKVELGFKVSQKMIADMEAKLHEAISREDWERAAYLKSYINGMEQIEIVFSQAVG
jgi:protein-arginine kinase activator protein McsA